MTSQWGPQTEFSDHLHSTKYRGPNEDFEEAANRWAFGLADDGKHYHAFRDVVLPQRFCPGGRVQGAVGASRKTTSFNCYVSGTIEDSLIEGSSSIMQRVLESAATAKLGGGIGYDFSRLRPRNDPVRSIESNATGPVSFMEIFNTTGLTIQSSGHRRGAQMAILACWHPDIEEFIRAKQKEGALSGFNLSVAVTDEFMQAVETDGEFELKFASRVYRTVRAQDLWQKIMRATWDWAEPGVFFVDSVNAMNNLWYCEQITACNPCVPGDTPILTGEGYVSIMERVGLLTDIWNGEEWVKVTPFSTGFNETVIVKFSDGTELRCTPAHEFVLYDNSRCTAEDLVPGVKLAKFEMPIVPTGDIIEGDAYSQGFYSGDGSKGLTRSFLYDTKFCCIRRLKGRLYELKNDPSRKVWNHGPMFDKSFVPVNGEPEYKLDWLAGVLDADGTVTRDENGAGFQLSSIDRDFLLSVRLMLTTLGVRAKVVKGHEAGMHMLPDGNGGSKEYPCQACFRLLIGNSDAYSLMELGLRLSRLQHHGKPPQRDARQFVRVLSVEDAEPCETFCFTEPKTNRGTFNGIVTGQCGEQPLPPYGACLLGSFNLPKYLRKKAHVVAGTLRLAEEPVWEFDYDLLCDDIPIVVRAMDNVIDKSYYPLAQQKEEAKNKRRMGLGVMGLANAGEALGFSYGSPDFIKWMEHVLTIIRDECYIASIEIARDKGSFPAFDRDKYLQGNFIKTLPDGIRQDIAAYGIRNSHLTSIAPTGTIALCADNVSSGIEPVFEYVTKRPVNMPSGQIVVTIEDYGSAFLGVKGKLAKDVTAQEHVNVLLTAQRCVDSAVTKTINMDGSIMPWDDFCGIYSQVWRGGGKGCTTYNISGKRMGLLSAAEGQSCEIDPLTGKRDCG
jgi:ribonucleoside-diphosphate reductase alpha chain